MGKKKKRGGGKGRPTAEGGPGSAAGAGARRRGQRGGRRGGGGECAEFVSPPALPASLELVRDDAGMGLRVRTLESAQAGQVLLVDSAVAFADWNDREEAHGRMATEDSAIEEELASEFAVLGELDRSRLFLKCLDMQTRSAEALAFFASLTAAHESTCKEAARDMMERALLPDKVQKSDLQAVAHLIGALNANSHELESIGGSALFGNACRLEHACGPNCAFITSPRAPGDEGLDPTRVVCHVKALRDIAAGEYLSIDYISLPFAPRHIRRQRLAEVYEFDCACAVCASPNELDRARAVTCASCGTSQCCPRYAGAGSDNILEMACAACGDVSRDNATMERLVQSEQRLRATPPGSLGELEAAVETYKLGLSHYCVYPLLDALLHDIAFQRDVYSAKELSELLSESPIPVAWAFPRDDLSALISALAQAWVKAVDFMLPPGHPHRLVCWDKAGQLFVVAGDLARAREAFEAALAIARVCGSQHDVDALRDLAERTPSTAAELWLRHGR